MLNIIYSFILQPNYFEECKDAGQPVMTDNVSDHETSCVINHQNLSISWTISGHFQLKWAIVSFRHFIEYNRSYFYIRHYVYHFETIINSRAIKFSFESSFLTGVGGDGHPGSKPPCIKVLEHYYISCEPLSLLEAWDIYPTGPSTGWDLVL